MLQIHSGVQREEILQRHVLFLLNHSLKIWPEILQKHLHVVSGFDSDAVTVLILLIEILVYCAAIIGWNSAILHVLDVTAVMSQGGASLRTISTHPHGPIGHEAIRMDTLVYHFDRRGHWIVVCCNILV